MSIETKNRVELVEEVSPGYWKYNWHYFQSQAMRSKKRFIAMFAGTGGGKTIMGPAWLHKEIERCGPGDYIVGTSTNKLMRYTLLPEFLRLFKRRLDLGVYKKADQQFKYYDNSVNIYFFSAVNPESIESAHANAAWLDECGQQQFKQATWEAVQRRVGEKEGRVLMTTTLYTMGWMRNEIYLPWQKGEDTDIDVIQFPSIANPNYSQKEFERQRRKMPPWKFKMFYLGQFDKPAGLIYNNFIDSKHKIKRFEIPLDWPRYVGVDFGSKNTAALWYAMNPHTGELFLYREYLHAGEFAKWHVARWKEISKNEWILKCAGGSHQEAGWRQAFTDAGWPISEPMISEVDVGIDAVYEMHQEDRIYVFEDCKGYIADKTSYSWALDDNYEPIYGKIDRKAKFHFMDAERYIMSMINRKVSAYQKRIIKVQNFV